MTARQLAGRQGAAFVLALGTLVFHAAPAQPAAADGKALFQKRCGGCHAVDRDMEGPRLGGVYGRPAGIVQSFGYSAALKGTKIVWNEQTLDKWLSDPEKVAPGTEMEFRVEAAGERQIIIAYLKSLPAR